jgi:hypothetical protein
MTTSQEMDAQFGDSEIERRLKLLEEKVAAYEQGGFDIFRQFGYLQLGLNLPRIASNGIQIASDSVQVAGLYFLNKLLVDPEDATTYLKLDTLISPTAVAGGLVARGSPGGHAEVILTTGTNSEITLSVFDPAGALGSGFVDLLWSSGQDLALFSMTRAVLRLASLTAEPAGTVMGDGDIWYRSDTDVFKGRRNGVTSEFIMDGDTEWVDLTDGGETALHSHAGGGFLETANTGQFLIPAGPANGNWVRSGAANTYGSWYPLPFTDAVAPAAATETVNNASVLMPPTVAAGDLLIVLAAAHTGNTVGTGSGFTLLGSGTNTIDLRVFYKVADGTEDGTTVSFTNCDVAQVYRILAANYVGVPTISTAATGTSTSADPTAVVPPASRFLSIAVAAVQGDSTVNVTASPSGYSTIDNIQEGAGSDVGGVSMGSAYLVDSGVSENPGAFTNGSNPWVAFAVAIAASNAVLEATYITDLALVPGGTPAYAQVQIGSGAVGAESAIGTLKLTDEGWEKTLQAVIPVSLGARLSARIATDAGAADHFLTLGMLNQDDVA